MQMVLALWQVLGGHFGLPCNPPHAKVSKKPRTDIIQAVQLGERKKLVEFCEVVQKHSPVGAYIRPTPGPSPGYGGEVIFADGTIQLCDVRLAMPYTKSIGNDLIFYPEVAMLCDQGALWMEQQLSSAAMARSESPTLSLPKAQRTTCTGHSSWRNSHEDYRKRMMHLLRADNFSQVLPPRGPHLHRDPCVNPGVLFI